MWTWPKIKNNENRPTRTAKKVRKRLFIRILRKKSNFLVYFARWDKASHNIKLAVIPVQDARYRRHFCRMNQPVPMRDSRKVCLVGIYLRMILCCGDELALWRNRGEGSFSVRPHPLCAHVQISKRSCYEIINNNILYLVTVVLYV